MSLDHLDTIISFVAIIAGVSLLVTTLTQAVSALLGLRGTNLRWGVETLLRQAAPGLASHARVISEKALQHPLVSDSAVSGVRNVLTSRWRLASGIRKDELLHVLRSMAQPDGAAADKDATEPWTHALRESLDVLDRQKIDRLLVLAPAIRKALPDDAAAAEEVISLLSSRAESISGEIDRWFDSVMDRVAQRFALHARIWTIAFSVVLAFALHLDAFRIFRELSADSELRSRVLAGADAMVRKAEEIQATTPGATPVAAYRDAMVQLIANHPADLKALPPPPAFADGDAARAWLRTQLQTAGLPETDPLHATWTKRYDDLVPMSALRVAADRLNSVVSDQMRFNLVPHPYPPLTSYWIPSWSHFWGTLASAALLSLGGPFWFHLLKDMSALRPVLAKKRAKEEEATAGG